MTGHRSAQPRSLALVVLRSSALGAGLLATLVYLHGCLVTEHCYSNADCSSGKVCLSSGQCGFECEVDADCGAGMGCVYHRCAPKSVAPIACPPDMVNVADAFCVDRYEASRPDATATSFGVDGSVARSRSGVMPWQLFPPEGNATARAACMAAGKDLCTPQQWQAACQGRAGTVYGYGDIYEPSTCNGIDTFGTSDFHLLPTGSLSKCKSDWGAYDMNGNLWEHTLNGSERTIRGGAYNCKDSQTLHRCDYVPGDWEPTARGFRCCLVPTSAPDAGLPDVSAPDASHDSEAGCLDDDGAVSPDGALDAVDDGGDAAVVDVATDTADSGSQDAAEDLVSGCPSDMVLVGTFCMDVYEASHEDATATSMGTAAVAASRAGVLPWFPVTLDQARTACSAAGKRLCRLDEWIESCAGPLHHVYSYGDAYDPAICNGIDSFCYCGVGSCAQASQCPYPHCFNQASTEGYGPCGADFHVMPTGSFPGCHNALGVYDINGNVWEVADTQDGLEHFRGGAYNCGDSEALHRCDHDGTWGPSARGFRCCKDPQ
jgi:sulfatase modifying factor 1